MSFGPKDRPVTRMYVGPVSTMPTWPEPDPARRAAIEELAVALGETPRALAKSLGYEVPPLRKMRTVDNDPGPHPGVLRALYDMAFLVVNNRQRTDETVFVRPAAVLDLLAWPEFITPDKYDTHHQMVEGEVGMVYGRRVVVPACLRSVNDDPRSYRPISEFSSQRIYTLGGHGQRHGLEMTMAWEKDQVGSNATPDVAPVRPEPSAATTTMPPRPTPMESEMVWK